MAEVRGYFFSVLSHTCHPHPNMCRPAQNHATKARQPMNATTKFRLTKPTYAIPPNKMATPTKTNASSRACALVLLAIWMLHIPFLR